MKRTALTILGAAGLVTAALSGPANAAPTVTPNGSFGFNFSGSLTVDTTNITAATSSKTFGVGTTFSVNTTPTGNLGVSLGDVISLGTLPITLPVPAIASGLVNITPFTVTDTTIGLDFTFNQAFTTSIVPTGTGGAGGSFAENFLGTIDSDTTGTFILGQSASLSESCTQTGLGVAINCSETVATPSSVTPPGVPEPTSMALLGSALVGFGVFRRRRKTS